MSGARIVPRASMRAGCPPPPPPTQSLDMAAPPRGGASPALTRAIGLGHHPSIHPITIILLHSLPARRSPASASQIPSRVPDASFLPALPPTSSPRPADQPTNQAVGRPAGEPEPPAKYAHTRSTGSPLRTEPCAEPADAGNLAPRRGSKLGAYVRYMDRARNGARQCARVPPPPSRDMHETKTARSRPTRARACQE